MNFGGGRETLGTSVPESSSETLKSSALLSVESVWSVRSVELITSIELTDPLPVEESFSIPVRVTAKLMTPFVPLALFGWIPLVLYLFSRYPSQRAVVISFVAGFLFLPQVVKYPIVQGIPPYEKFSAISYAVLLATIIFEPGRLSSFKPGWIDLPMLFWCLCPVVTQSMLGLSPISPTTGQIILWGVPYLLGRIYFNDLAGLRQLAIGIFAGGMVYVPLCLLETRIAPTLHLRLYGFHARDDFGQTIRYGGYRPTVFLDHGLAVGLWMMAAALVGVWLWKTGVIKKLWGYPVSWLVPVLLITFVLVKSTGAYLYWLIGVAVLFTAGWLRTTLPLVVLVIALSSYLYLGATGTLYTIPQVRAMIASSQSQGGNERSQSLAFRIANEEILSQKARVRIGFGWGDSGGNRVYDATGKDISVTDSIWIIVYGQYGVAGLIAFTSSLFVPCLAFGFLRYPASTWSNRKVAPAAGLVLVIILFMLDSVLNAMTCPVFILANGGIAGVVMRAPEPLKAKTARPSLSTSALAQQR